MDIARHRPRSQRPLFLVVAGVAAALGGTVVLSRLKAAAPNVERSAVWIDTVKRGDLLRQVKGPGTLVPEQIRWLTADTAGRVEQIHLRPGARVEQGTLLAKVVQPEKLKAQLRVPETQARDLAMGELAEIDTRNGVIPGKVTRIAPAAKEGTVLVEIGLEGELPKGARPDLTVEGVIELEKLTQVLCLGRPAGAQPEGQMELFVLTADGEGAVRTRLTFGRSSVSAIEVKGGAQEGDRVVLSDMSTWDQAERVSFR